MLTLYRLYIQKKYILSVLAYLIELRSHLPIGCVVASDLMGFNYGNSKSYTILVYIYIYI